MALPPEMYAPGAETTTGASDLFSPHPPRVAVAQVAETAAQERLSALRRRVAGKGPGKGDTARLLEAAAISACEKGHNPNGNPEAIYVW